MIRLFDEPIPFRAGPPARRAPRPRARYFEAAAQSHLTADFDGGIPSTDAQLRFDLRRMRNRARNLENNNGSMVRFLEISRANIIGQGIRLQCNAKIGDGTADANLNRRIEVAWKEWGRPENASASGRLSLFDLENFLVTSLQRDGEALFQKTTRGKWGFSLRPIDAAYLDETYNTTLPSGNRVIMSVEIDEFERPVAYHLRPPLESRFYRQELAAERVRVPAEQIIHIFFARDAVQVRGVPPVAPVLFEMRMLGGYKQAEVVAARVSACKSGFYKKPPVENDSYNGEGDDPAEKQTAPIEEMEPGSFAELPDGWDFVPFDPQHPTTAFKDFVSGALHGIAAGLNVSYESLAGDLSQVNFSSARIGSLIEQKIWKRVQQFVIQNFHENLFLEWIRAAALTKNLNITPEEIERAKRPRWMPPGWAYANPKQEIDADVTAIENALDTRAGVLADRGLDFFEVVEQLAAEKAYASQMGVELTAKPTTSNANDTPSPPVDANGSEN